jgi:hypothetical protein
MQVGANAVALKVCAGAGIIREKYKYLSGS